MNSTFKVVFNKARGALMVVNEVTSSVQAKGTKTVVAAAVATMIAGVAGTAMAAEWEVAPEGLEAATDTVITDANWAAIKDQNAFELTSSDKEAKKSWASVAKDAYGMRVGTGDTASKIVNNGLISVGEVNTESSQLPFGHGVLIQDQTGAKFTNNGTITAGKGATAIEIKKVHSETTGEVVLKGNSKIDGLIHVASNVKSATIIAKDSVTDTLTLKAENVANDNDIQGTELNVQTNSTITLADKQANKLAKVVVDETSRLNLSIMQADNAVKNAQIEGILNITKLNSGGSEDQTQANATPHDKLLLAYDSTWNLNGGKLYVAGTEYTGTLRIGTANETKGSGELNVSEGSALNLTRLEVQKLGTVNVNANGSITTETLKLSKGKVNVNGGSLTVTGNKGFTVFKGTDGSTPALTLANGTFTVDAGSLFQEKAATASAADAQKTYEATEAANAITGTGTVNVTSKAFEYSLADLNAAQNLIDNNRSIKVVFTNGTLTLKEGETLDAKSISGLNLAGHTGVAGDDGAFAVDKPTTVGAIDFKAVTNKDATSITLGNTAALTLAGNDGDVFKNLGAKVTTVTTGDLVLGTAGNSGNVNVDTLKTEALTVAGDFSARAVEATTAKIDGILTANSVKTTDGAKVTGALVLTGNVKKDVSELTGKVTVTDRGVLTTNRAAGLAYAADYADEDLSVAYVDRQLKLAEGAEINVGEAPATGALAAAATTTDRTVNVNANGIYGIDAASFLYTGKPAAEADLSVFGNSTALNLNGGKVEILNITKLGQIDLGGAIKNTANIDTDSIYVVVNDNGVDATTGVVTLSYNDGLVADKTVDARLKDAFTKGVGAKEFAILSALDTPAFFDEKTEKFTEAGNKAFEQATGGNATAGVLNVAYDANAQVTDAIVRHQLSEHAGMGVWADVFYAKNEAKKLYGDFGYSADIYGGILGFDYTAACGGTLGAALTVGTADADSEGGVLSNSLSSDFVGLSVYASKDFSGLNVKADLGYIDFSNDFTGLGDASDATTITFGVRGDFTAYQNGAFSVVPHMGLRYTRIDTDAVAFNDEQNMNVLEAPIGVKFSGTFEATGWKLVPSYDFTIVPQLGDKEVEAFGTAGDITILSGGLFNNVLGVEAVKDNMSFGLNASYGFGPDDRANTQVNANFRYHF